MNNSLKTIVARITNNNIIKMRREKKKRKRKEKQADDSGCVQLLRIL